MEPKQVSFTKFMPSFISNIKSNNHSLCTKLQESARNCAFNPDDDMLGRSISNLRHFEQRISNWLGPPVLKPVREVRPLFQLEKP